MNCKSDAQRITASHYDMLVLEDNDPARDGDVPRAYMDKWDGAPFLDALSLSPEDDVLETGVGTGRLARRVLEHGCRSFTGVDISPLSLERARENLSGLTGFELILTAFPDMPSSRRYDVIYSSLTFMHIEDKKSAVDAAASLLKAGGRLVLSLSRDKSTQLDFGTRIIPLYPDSTEEITNYMAQAGLTDIKVIPTEFAEIVCGVRTSSEKPQVSFYPPYIQKNEDYVYAVVAAIHDGKWLFVRHRARTTWELPAGHREDGEHIDAAASRELYEETGAADFDISPVASYSVALNGHTRFGMLYLAMIRELSTLPESEIAEVIHADGLPEALTYPDIQPFLWKKAAEAYRQASK